MVRRQDLDATKAMAEGSFLEPIRDGPLHLGPEEKPPNLRVSQGPPDNNLDVLCNSFVDWDTGLDADETDNG
eukprot:5148512-Lingulodinium_polyedra.AAC.1